MSEPLSLTQYAKYRIAETLRSYWTGVYNLKDPDAAAALGMGSSSTGVEVTAATALNFSAVWAAVAIISGDVASLPLILYKRDGESSKTRYTDSKLYELLHDAPNPEMSSFVWRETCQGHVMTWGNAYSEIERNGAGRPMALWPITPNRVTPSRDRLGNIFYRVSQDDGTEVPIPAADMLHVPGLGFDGMCGYSVIQKARETIGLGLATERFGGEFFGNGTTFGGVLSHPGKLTKDVKQGIRESIDAIHTGVDRAHRFAIFGDGIKFEKTGIPPNDAQFLETRRFQVNEIARWFLIPPHKLGDLDRATFSNIEQQDIEYYKSGLRRWLVRWEQEINRKLIAPLERKQQFVEHNVDGLLRGDSQARAEYYSKMFNIGAYSINMILEKENMNGIGAAGDVHFVPVNMTTADLAKDGPPKPAPVQPQPTPEPTPQPKRDEAIDQEFRALLADIAGKAAEIQTCLASERDTEQEQAAHLLALKQLEDERYALQVKFDDFRARHAEDVITQTAEQIAAAAQVTEELQRVKQADADRLAGMLTAHRALFVHAMTRIIREEVDKARRHQATPQKFRHWLEAFYAVHGETCINALRPAVRVHLAWKQSAEDVDAVTMGIVQAHIEESTRQLQAVLEGSVGDEFGPMLERTLSRWEQQRPDALADRILREDVAYVRAVA